LPFDYDNLLDCGLLLYLVSCFLAILDVDGLLLYFFNKLDDLSLLYDVYLVDRELFYLDTNPDLDLPLLLISLFFSYY